MLALCVRCSAVAQAPRLPAPCKLCLCARGKISPASLRPAQGVPVSLSTQHQLYLCVGHAGAQPGVGARDAAAAPLAKPPLVVLQPHGQAVTLAAVGTSSAVPSCRDLEAQQPPAAAAPVCSGLPPAPPPLFLVSRGGGCRSGGSSRSSTTSGGNSNSESSARWIAPWASWQQYGGSMECSGSDGGVTRGPAVPSWVRYGGAFE